MRDLYKVLGIDRSADIKTIKSAYRIKAQIKHPDKPTGSEKEFMEIQRAYKILSNKERRKLYDSNGSIDDIRNVDLFAQAKQEIGTIFMQYCLAEAVVNPLVSSRDNIRANLEQFKVIRKKCQKSRKLMARRIKNLSSKGKNPEDILKCFINYQRKNIYLQYRDCSQKIKLCEFMLEYLEDYEYYQETIRVHRPIYSTGTSTISFFP